MIERYRREMSVAVAIAVLAVVLAMVAPGFFTWENLSDDLRQKMLWENPVRFYGEP